MRWRTKILFALLFFVILVFCVLFHKPCIDYSKFSATSGYTITYVLIDGMSKDIFEKELFANRLPNMKRLIEKSTYVENGIGSFPSMTGYAFYPFITGRDATESGILGLRWFDRLRNEAPLRNYVGRTNIHMNDDISDSIKTYFELSDKQYTASINTYMNRGVFEQTMTGLAHTTAKYSSEKIFKTIRSIPLIGKRICKNHFEHESQVTDIAIEQLRHNPKVQWLTYPSPDAQNHVHGTDSTYYLLLRHIDKEIGRLIQASENLGQSKRRIFAIITDHGISDVSKNIDICHELKRKLNLNIERGKSANLLSSKMPGTLEDLSNTDGFFVINGNLCGYLYFKDPTKHGVNAWRKHLNSDRLSNYQKNGSPCNLIHEIANIDGVELLSYRVDSTTIMVQNKKGKAQIKKQGAKYCYQIIDYDVLEYGSFETKSQIYFSKDEWIEKTFMLKFPGAIPRLYEVVSKNNCGDILITSESGYDLANNYELFVGNYKGGHGGLRGELLRVSYIINIPGELPKYTLSTTSEEFGKMIGGYLFPDECLKEL